MTENKSIGKSGDEDKKSLDNLINNLLKLKNKEKEAQASKSSKPSTSNNGSTHNFREKMKRNISPTKHNKNKSSPRRKRALNVENNTTITSWLNKENHQESNTKRRKVELNKNEKSSCDSKSKMKPLDIVVSKETTEKKSNVKTVNKTKEKKKFERNPSFEKYGIAMPSFEKIVEDQKKFDEHRNRVKDLEKFDDGILEKSFKILDKTEKFSGEILDCKHLSLEELDDIIEKYIPVLKDILTEKKYSERHQRFHKFNMKDYLTTKDLSYSTSLVVFNQEQKDYMLDIMKKEFDPEDRMTTYFFKVLLPELCLLVFMDVHKMTKRSANNYLDKRPLDI